MKVSVLIGILRIRLIRFVLVMVNRVLNVIGLC